MGINHVESVQNQGESQKRDSKMNDRKLEIKIRQDIAKVKKDLKKLAGHGTARVSRFQDNVYEVTGNARADLTTWVEENVTQMSKEFEKLTGDAKDAVVSAAAMVKKDVGHGLRQYNAKVQELADKAPGGFGKKAVRYPWVAVTITMVIGFMLGMLIKPARRLVSYP
jgi:ElaB/YqjD/DUF883 family membrane-anchored ribosome-binding protein